MQPGLINEKTYCYSNMRHYSAANMTCCHNNRISYFSVVVVVIIISSSIRLLIHRKELCFQLPLVL